MLKPAYFLAKIGADTAENERIFAANLGKIGNYPTGLSAAPTAPPGAPSGGRSPRGPSGAPGAPPPMWSARRWHPVMASHFIS